MARPAGIMHRSEIASEGLAPFQNKPFVLIEKISNNSINTDPMNKLVWSMDEPLLTNKRKKRKTKAPFITPKKRDIETISRTL